MSTLCSTSNNCSASNVLSIGRVIGVVVGLLTLLATTICVIIFIIILCKKKPRQPVVWVPPQPYQTDNGYNQSMNMNYYSLYDQLNGLSVYPPAYQQENIPTISDGKVEA
jgi:hypothetical protein